MEHLSLSHIEGLLIRPLKSKDYDRGKIIIGRITINNNIGYLLILWYLFKRFSSTFDSIDWSWKY